MPWRMPLYETALDRQVADHVISAVNRLLDADAHLFEVCAGERAISHRVAGAMGQITSASGEIGTWAREMLEQRIVSNLKNHVIAGATEKST